MKNHFIMKTKGVGYVKQKKQLFVISASNRKTKNNNNKKTIYLDENSEELDDVLASDC